MMDVDPLSLVGRVNFAYMLGRARRLEEAHQIGEDVGRRSARFGFLIHALISNDYEGRIADSTGWYLQALALDPDDTFARHRLAINFSAGGLYEEGRRLAPELNWLVSTYEQRWAEAIAAVRQNLDDDPTNNEARMIMANVLHMSGEVAEAQVLYEELFQQNPGFVILDPVNTSPMPTVRMAFGAKAGGDNELARTALTLLKADQRERAAVGIRNSYVLRGAAMAASIQGDADGLVASLEAAIEAGLRDHFILREPAFAPYVEHPGFQAQATRLDAILKEERSGTLRLICLENPAPEVWKPLPETCAGVD